MGDPSLDIPRITPSQARKLIDEGGRRGDSVKENLRNDATAYGPGAEFFRD